MRIPPLLFRNLPSIPIRKVTVKSESHGGLSVFLGCSHPGVANCLRHIVSLFAGRRIKAVVGGMHLENVGPQRLQDTIKFLEDLNLQKIVPLHCTGLAAAFTIKERFKDRCLLLKAGDSFEL